MFSASVSPIIGMVVLLGLFPMNAFGQSNDPSSDEARSGRWQSGASATVVEVLDFNTLAVRIQGKEEVVRLKELASREALVEAERSGVDSRNVTTKHASRALKYAPAVVNYLRAFLQPPREVFLVLMDKRRDDAGRLLAQVRVPVGTGAWFEDLETTMLSDGLAIPTPELWDTPIRTPERLRPEELYLHYFWVASALDKSGVWAEGSPGRSVHSDLPLPTDVQPSLVVPLPEVTLPSRTGPSHAQIANVPCAALTIVCNDRRSVSYVISRTSWLNATLANALGELSATELLADTVRARVEDEMRRSLRKKLASEGQNISVQRISLRRLFVLKQRR